MLCYLHFGIHKLCFVNAASGRKETEWMDKIKIKSRDCWRLFITVLVVHVSYLKGSRWCCTSPNKNLNKYTHKYGSDHSSNIIFQIKATQINVMYYIFYLLRLLYPAAGFVFFVACFTALPGFPHTSLLKFACERFPGWMFREGDHLSVGQLGRGAVTYYTCNSSAALTIIYWFFLWNKSTDLFQRKYPIPLLPPPTRLDEVKTPSSCRHQSCLWRLGCRMFCCCAVQQSPFTAKASKRTARSGDAPARGQAAVCCIHAHVFDWRTRSIRVNVTK